MLHLEGDEVDSDNDNSDKESQSNKEENKIKSKKSEEQIINNKNIKKVISKKITGSESDNFFKGDSNNYDIMGTNSKNINNNNSLNNNKENEENENSEDDLNFTPVDDDRDNFSYHNENENNEEKKEEINNNNNVENSLENNNNFNNSNHSNKLENKDNNNNNDSNSLSKKNKDNNSESSDQKNINNSLNNNDNKVLNSNNNINNESQNKNDESNNSENSNKKYTNEESKENNNDSSFSEKNSNLNQNQNLNNKNEEENIINKNNQSIQFEIKQNEEKNNINNNKDMNKSSEDEEDEQEEKNDNNSISSNNNESINKNNNNKENILEKNENNNSNNIKMNNKKTVLKFSKNELSSIKDNNSSINKEQNSEEDSFSLNSNSGKKKKKKDGNENNINNINIKKSENSDSSEQSQKQKNKNDNNGNDMIKILKKMETSNLNEKEKSNNNNNKKSIHLNDIIFIKDEYYINYIKLKRKGFKNILDKNYVNGYSTFSECYELSSKYLKDKIKQIDSLINMSICQYYNGNFNNSITLLFNAKKLFATISLGECHISLRDKIRLGIKLYTNSSMSNLSFNNYKESINDIKYIIDLIEQENNLEKKLELYKYTIYLLFKADTLLNIKNENDIINNIKNNFNYNSSDKNLIDLNGIKNNKEINDIYIDTQNEKIMNDFLSCLKYKNFLIILNSFIENASLYKKNKNMLQYYFCIFNQYLITYNNTINTQENNEENINEIKERLFICYKNLVGEEISTKIKEKNKNKDIFQFLNEFNKKMECAFEIFSLLENYEKSINNITQDLYKEKKDDKIIDKKKYKNKFKLNEESPFLVKLCLKYSLNYLNKKRDFLINNANNKKQTKNKNENNDSEINNNSEETINNLNLLIKELEILIKKINSYEIDISSIKKTKINPDIINNIKILFQHLSKINYKSMIYLTFHKFREKLLKIKLNEMYLNIDNFLDKNYELIIKGMRLMKINYSSKGHKYYFYNIDSDSNTLQIRQKEGDPYPLVSYNLFKDVTKITYGIKSKNLIKKLKNKNECNDETRKYLRMPWRFISFVLQKKSIDLYLENDQVDTWFYGLKNFTKNDVNDVEYKISSTNKFLLNKVKYRIVIKLKCAVNDGEIVEEKSVNLVKKILKEKAVQNITFTKLILLYNKLVKDK